MTRKIAAMLVLSLALAAPARSAADEWTAADTAWEAAFVGAVFLDWQQTRYFLYEQKPQHWREINPVLGPNPRPARLNLFEAGAVLGHAAVARALPASWRRPWQALTTAVELGMVARNAGGGVGVRVNVAWW